MLAAFRHGDSPVSTTLVRKARGISSSLFSKSRGFDTSFPSISSRHLYSINSNYNTRINFLREGGNPLHVNMKELPDSIKKTGAKKRYNFLFS